MDENGIIYLLDRKKDMIVSGARISTPKVEAVLYQHPDIQECAVVGIPDDKFEKLCLQQLWLHQVKL